MNENSSMEIVMGNHRSRRARALCLIVLAGACGCTHVSKMALLSDGELAGRSLANMPPGPILKGEDCARLLEPPQHRLSSAVRDAIKGTDFDTLVDVEVTTRTGFLVTSNCIAVQGKGVRSSELSMVEVGR